ncbi:MAG: hypothetical protein QM736_03165 [Vicinamibacterales bacterium]
MRPTWLPARSIILIILGGNPVYNAPADLNFAAALDKVQTSVYLTQFNDETAQHCQWIVPEAHFLEAWSDARGHDGTASIVQPLIAPLYGGRSAHEVIGVFGERPERPAYDVIRQYPGSSRSRRPTSMPRGVSGCTTA